MNQLNERTSMSLGDRIILAARLAVAEHLGQSMAQQHGAREVTIGEAGPNWSSEQSTTLHRPLAPSRPSRFSEGEAA